MTLDFPTLLIAAVFAAQILVLSFLCPEWFYRASLAMRTKYPPQEFPRLYPIAPDRIDRQNMLLRMLHWVIGIAGAMALLYGLLSHQDATQLMGLMLRAFMVQLLPPLLRLPLQIRLIRAFRAMPAPAVRSADLRQWRVTELVSPAWIALGLTLSVLSLACVAWLYVKNPSQNLRLHAFCFIVSLWLLGRMLYVLLGSGAIARPDPYMSADDVFRSRQWRVRLPFVAAAFLGAYFLFMELYAARQLRFDFVYVAAGVSLLAQLLYLRVTHVALRMLATRDLSNYRGEAAVGRESISG